MNQWDWLALHLIPSIGVKTIQHLQSCFGNLEQIFTTSPEEITRKSGLSLKLAHELAHAKSASKFQRECELLQNSQTQLVCLDQPEYPQLLQEISAPPPVLYYNGRLPKSSFFISFVGSRNCTSYGREATKKIIFELAGLVPDAVIISGLARGIDSIAHQTALEAGLNTIAVLAGGVNHIYPKENIALSEKITHQGCLLSEFPMTSKPLGKHFAIRNRIISGLSHAVVIIEAGQKSGSLITAGFAFEQNREVFAIPDRIFSSHSYGSHRLISKNQAKLIQSAHDILEEHFQSRLSSRPSSQTQATFEFHTSELDSDNFDAKQKIPHETLTESQNLILQTLGQTAVSFDDLCEKTQMNVPMLSSTLTELELQGFITLLENQHYEISHGMYYAK